MGGPPLYSAYYKVESEWVTTVGGKRGKTEQSERIGHNEGPSTSQPRHGEFGKILPRGVRTYPHAVDVLRGSLPQAMRTTVQELTVDDPGFVAPVAVLDPLERDLPQERDLEKVLLAMCQRTSHRGLF